MGNVVQVNAASHHTLRHRWGSARPQLRILSKPQAAEISNGYESCFSWSPTVCNALESRRNGLRQNLPSQTGPAAIEAPTIALDTPRGVRPYRGIVRQQAHRTSPIAPLRQRGNSAKVPPCHRSPEKSLIRSSHCIKDLASPSVPCSVRPPRSAFQMFRRQCNLAIAACTFFKRMKMGWRNAWRASCARRLVPPTVFTLKLPKTLIRTEFQLASATRKYTTSIIRGASSADTASKPVQRTLLPMVTASSSPHLTSTPLSFARTS